MIIKSLDARVKILQDSNESDKKMSVMAQEVKEEDNKKVQDNQQLREMQPRLVKVELKEAQVHQEAQDDETQTLKQAEKTESTDSNFSEILVIAASAILGLCEGIDSYRPPYSKSDRFNKYLKDTRK